MKNKKNEAMINNNLVKQEEDVKKESIQKLDAQETETKTENKDFWGKLGNYVNKAIDCCIE